MLTMPSQQPCGIDNADGDHPPPFTRYPSFCPSSQSIPTALERLGPKALILIIRAPAAQLQHNMWVTNATAAVLSIITGGGKWVEIKIPADSLYQHRLLTAEKKFWRCSAQPLRCLYFLSVDADSIDQTDTKVKGSNKVARRRSLLKPFGNFNRILGTSGTFEYEISNGLAAVTPLTGT